MLLTLTENKRMALFLIGCMGARSLLAYLTYLNKSSLIKWIGVFTLLIGIGFWYLFITKGRPTGPEAGGEIWWKNLRPIHGTLYLIASIMIFTNKYSSKAWIILVLDLLLGLVVFLNHHLFI